MMRPSIGSAVIEKAVATNSADPNACAPGDNIGALIVFLATLGKYGGAYLAARIAGMSHQEGKVMGIMMNTRALMELIVINVGYDLGVISQQMFTLLVIMAIFSTVITSPLLRRWLPRIGIPLPARSTAHEQHYG